MNAPTETDREVARRVLRRHLDVTDDAPVTWFGFKGHVLRAAGFGGSYWHVTIGVLTDAATHDAAVEGARLGRPYGAALKAAGL